MISVPAPAPAAPPLAPAAPPLAPYDPAPDVTERQIEELQASVAKIKDKTPTLLADQEKWEKKKLLALDTLDSMKVTRHD